MRLWRDIVQLNNDTGYEVVMWHSAAQCETEAYIGNKDVNCDTHFAVHRWETVIQAMELRCDILQLNARQNHRGNTDVVHILQISSRAVPYGQRSGDIHWSYKKQPSITNQQLSLVLWQETKQFWKLPVWTAVVPQEGHFHIHTLPLWRSWVSEENVCVDSYVTVLYSTPQHKTGSDSRETGHIN